MIKEIKLKKIESYECPECWENVYSCSQCGKRPDENMTFFHCTMEYGDMHICEECIEENSRYKDATT